MLDNTFSVGLIYGPSPVVASRHWSKRDSCRDSLRM